jgi:hypothetical protein
VFDRGGLGKYVNVTNMYLGSHKTGNEG